MWFYSVISNHYFITLGKLYYVLRFRNQLKLSAFTSITAEIKLSDSHHVSQSLKAMFTVESRCQE